MDIENTQSMIDADAWSVVFTVLVALMAAYVAASTGKKERYWVTGSVLAVGAGLWAMYFIGALALGLPTPTAYSVPTTLLSLMIVVLVSGFVLRTTNAVLDKRATELSQSNALLEQLHIQNSKQVERRRENLEVIVNNANDAIIGRTFNGTILSWNAAAERMFGYTATEALGRPATFILPPGEQSHLVRNTEKVLNGEVVPPYESRRVTRDGRVIDVLVRMVPVRDPSGKIGSISTMLHDISELKKALEELNHLAQHDTLTGLPNRNLFRERLEGAMARARRHNRMLALLFLDLDRFKEINDTLGHAAGDAVLQAVAKLLKNSLRETDTVARLGGDEFTLILEDLAHLDQAKAAAEKILQMFSAPLVIEEREFYVTPSIGITLYPGSGEDIDTLLQTADVAMYHAKEEGRNTYEFYTPELSALTVEHLDMENLLRHALERHELLLHNQPKLAVKSGRITGVEALLRWNSKVLGSVPPGRFIPLAEKTGLIVPIGEWVLRTACAQSRAWRDQGLPPLLVSVNLSPRQFRQKDVVEMVARALRDTGLDPRLLELEITETMIMRHPDKAIAILQALHRLGVQLSVDDFGTGYSSLSYLKRFPVQKLKIDQSFMRDITANGDDVGIVTAVIAMAKSLALNVIAEGVETREQLAYLEKLGCEEYQGYYFSRPVPADEFARLLPCPTHLI